VFFSHKNYFFIHSTSTVVVVGERIIVIFVPQWIGGSTIRATTPAALGVVYLSRRRVHTSVPVPVLEMTGVADVDSTEEEMMVSDRQ
jgi:hypothetical protein